MSTKRILLVDDDPAILQVIESKLSAVPGIEVQSTFQPDQVRSLAKKSPPSLIVCDVDMQGMDGGAVAHALQQDPATQAIPFVFLTSLVDPAHIERNGGVVGGRRMISKQAPLPAIISRILSEAGAT